MSKSGSNEQSWWQQAVTYQVYVRSFADGDGDGTGDIEGLRSRLPYLCDLGVDAIWINPWFTSPLHDGGYDVADYRNINERYGTLDAAEDFIAEAHNNGLRVLCDLVPNHTSSEHRWFQEALASQPGDQARNRYHFRPGRGANGEEPPNNWRSVFGDIAWTRLEDGDWYLHLFDSSQPDLNWANPEVEDEFLEVFAFWYDRGVDGFRVDVAHGLSKDPGLPDVAPNVAAFDVASNGSHPYWDRNEVHDIIRRWRQLADTYTSDKVMVAEAWVAPERLPDYVAADQYHQSFNFDFLKAGWDAGARREVIERSLALMRGTGAMPTWVLSNHDVVRHASRFALPAGQDPVVFMLAGVPVEVDLGVGLQRARAAAMLMLALPGSVYLYQGEELGLPEVTDLPDEVLDDPLWRRSGHTIRGRDGCRVPIPWTRSGPSFGFGTGEAWLPQPDGFAELSVEAQSGVEGSTLELYRAALALRATRLATTTDFGWEPANRDDTIVFRRGAMVCAANLGSHPTPLPAGELLLASGPIDGPLLPGDTTAWIALEDI